MRMLLGEALRTAEDLPWTHALYSPTGGRHFDESVPVPVWIGDVQSIVVNAKAQRPNATTADLLLAFQHYPARDAFVVWSCESVEPGCRQGH